MGACSPLGNRLVVDDEVWLGQEPGEALNEAELGGCRSSVVSTGSTPEIECVAITMERADAIDDARNWNALRPDRADQGVVNIDKHDHETPFAGRLTSTLSGRRAAKPRGYPPAPLAGGPLKRVVGPHAFAVQR